MSKRDDSRYMKLALELAAKAKGKTYPNPMVGAVIVKGGKVVGKGYHQRAGKDHAEIKAIKSAGSKCRGAEMYVTLEPCDHFGKTPPCTQAIIDSGIKTVKFAMKDPNPLNNGRGIKVLRKSGISVSELSCGEEVSSLNRKYIKFIKKGMPYVTLKLAQSADGKTSARDGSSKWITSKASRDYAKNLRSNFDAIIVGANTLVNDNPLLLGKGRRGKEIIRVVVDSRLRTSISSKLVKTAAASPVIIATTELAQKMRLKKFRQLKGVEIIETKSKEKKVSLRLFLKKLAQRGIANLLVEGGGQLAASFMDEGLVDEVMFFIAPKIIGGAKTITSAIDLKEAEVKRIGKDILLRGLVKNFCHPERPRAKPRGSRGI
jgi:diaminohydroxyphosphoribosylaminopyrimidine deaminase/5-amino-6-(5-phosphoribosylamino)uracil reductase